MTENRWLDADEQRAWRRYVRMQADLTAHLARQLQTDSDLSLADFEVLVNLTDVPVGRVRVTELARSLQWEKSRLSHHVARMVRRGLVVREDCPSDARGAFVVLTPLGQRAIEAAAPGHVATVRRLVFDGLSSDQVETLAAIADTVLDRIERDAAGRLDPVSVGNPASAEDPASTGNPVSAGNSEPAGNSASSGNSAPSGASEAAAS